MFISCLISYNAIVPIRYEAKAKKEKTVSTGLPPGITPEIWASMKAQQRNQRYDPNVQNAKKDKPPQPAKSEVVHDKLSADPAAPKQAKSKGKKSGPKPQNKPQQNENVSLQVEPMKAQIEADEWVTVSNRKGRKNKKNSLTDVQLDQNIIDDNVNEVTSGEALKVSNESGPGKKAKQRSKAPSNGSNEKVKKDTAKKQSSKVTVVEKVASQESTDTDGVQADPAKKLRNLKKRLREIELLKTKEISTLDKDQVDKVKRYGEIKKLVKQLEETL